MMEKYTKTPIGERIKHWREQKGISQFDLALECDTSAKHLSFIETGRATPARELLISLLTFLDVPLEAINNLLISAGFAPSYNGTGLNDDEYQRALTSLDLLLANSSEQPALLIDKNWQLIKANQAFNDMCQQFCVNRLLYSCPAPNFLTLLLHPEGLIASVDDKSHFYRSFYSRARRVMAVMPESQMAKKLMDEIISYAPSPEDSSQITTPTLSVVAHFNQGDCQASYALSSVSLGEPLNVSLQERQMEIFMPLAKLK
jgi:transcriptional regulator with XRE-family HTH domain